MTLGPLHQCKHATKDLNCHVVRTFGHHEIHAEGKKGNKAFVKNSGQSFFIADSSKSSRQEKCKGMQ